MARIASQSQGGFYVTPPGEASLISNRLRAKPNALLNALDPCAGEGEALKQMGDYLSFSQNADVKAFGVELEEDRAEKAKLILGKVVKGGYETLRASNEVFSFLWLNPPYDNAKNGSRMELNFLRDLTQPNKYLQKGGLMGFCIPQHVLKDCAQLISFRFERVKVYRFADTNYPIFKQIVLFGYRAGSRTDPEKAKEVKEWLTQLGEGGPELLPTLDADDKLFFDIPESMGEVTMFRGSMLDPNEIAADIKTSLVWQQFEDLLMPPNLRNEATIKNPILPLKATHMATAISAGAVGGNMTNHILVGLTKKVVDNSKQTEERENGTTVEKHISIERHVTKIRVFSQHPGAEGVFTLE